MEEYMSLLQNATAVKSAYIGILRATDSAQHKFRFG